MESGAQDEERLVSSEEYIADTEEKALALTKTVDWRMTVIGPIPKQSNIPH